MKYSMNSKYEQLSKRSSGSLIDDESIGSTESQSSGKYSIMERQLSNFYDTWGQAHHLVLEGMLIVWVIWLISKKNNKSDLKLTEHEQDVLIKDFDPEPLITDVTTGHYSLKPHIVRGKVGKYINLDGVECLNFASHNYLGLLGNERIEDSALRTIEKYGVGSCGPRGFYGTTELHLALEKQLAEFWGMEDAVVYSLGFATVSSAIPAYAKRRDVVFADEKCNFAIQKGLDASRSIIRYFKHNDMKDLERILEETRQTDMKNMKKAMRSRRFLVVEGIYANTGDICPLPELIELRKKYKLRIFIDESISFGVLGKTGRGVTEYFDISRSEVDLIMASMENSLAAIGGFCVGSTFIVDHQRLSGLGYCFSASLPPVVVTAAMEGLKYIDDFPELMSKLKDISDFMYNRLKNSTIIGQAFDVTGDPHSPVALLSIKSNMKHIVINDIIDWCLQERLAVSRASFLGAVDTAITTPSLRITSSVFLSQDDVLRLVNSLENACVKLFLPSDKSS